MDVAGPSCKFRGIQMLTTCSGLLGYPVLWIIWSWSRGRVCLQLTLWACFSRRYSEDVGGILLNSRLHSCSQQLNVLTALKRSQGLWFGGVGLSPLGCIVLYYCRLLQIGTRVHPGHACFPWLAEAVLPHTCHQCASEFLHMSLCSEYGRRAGLPLATGGFLISTNLKSEACTSLNSSICVQPAQSGRDQLARGSCQRWCSR
jgi:hypothetical protein